MHDPLWIFYKFFSAKEILLKQFARSVNHHNGISTEQPDIDNRWKVYGLTVVICSRSLRVTAPSMRYYDYHYGDQLAYDRVMKHYRIAYNSYYVCLRLSEDLFWK